MTLMEITILTIALRCVSRKQVEEDKQNLTGGLVQLIAQHTDVRLQPAKLELIVEYK